MADHILNLLILLGTAGLSLRLYWAHLHRRYRAFFYYLIFYTVQTGFMMTLDIRSGLYQKVYIITEPVTWVFYALVVLELYSLVLEEYQGIYTVGRWLLIVAVTLAILSSALSLIAPSHNATEQSRLMWYYYVAERAIYLSLMVFLLTILFLLMQYPISLSRNIIVHSILYSVYFLSNTVIFLLLSTRGKSVLVLVDYFVMGISLAALGVWLVMLKPAGEERKVSLRPAWMPGREDELVSQLNNLNAALLRAARK
jgi:hypothetical protein